MVLGRDGTPQVVEASGTVNGTYEISDTKITLKPSDGLSSKTGKIQGDVITDPDGERWVKEK